MAGISLRNVSKVYPGNVTAVGCCSLEIRDKEFVVLVGPSGCGKSTTLRMIAGLEKITSGEMYIGDRLINDVLPKDRDIAMVFQNYALYPHMTVYKNMAFGLELRKTPKAEIDIRVRETARILNIEHLLMRKPKALSGGERQRVALGRAMVRKPEVFLLDEPLSNLDAKLRASMRTELIKLHQRLGVTFVYVTHDQTEAMTMGDRIVVMNDGTIQQIDDPQMLYESPHNIFVAGFIGSPQMNFLNVVLDVDDKGYFLRIANDSLYIPLGEYDDKLREHIGEMVKLGVRPEDIYDEREFNPTDTASAVEVTVEVVEMMGSDVYLYLKYVDIPLIARVSSTTRARSGDTIRIFFDMNNVHLFDAKSEEAILNACQITGKTVVVR